MHCLHDKIHFVYQLGSLNKNSDEYSEVNKIIQSGENGDVADVKEITQMCMIFRSVVHNPAHIFHSKVPLNVFFFDLNRYHQQGFFDLIKYF